MTRPRWMAESQAAAIPEQAVAAIAGLTPRAILEKFSTLQMVDVHLPTADGRLLNVAAPHPAHTRPRTAAASTQAAIARTTAAAHLGVAPGQTLGDNPMGFGSRHAFGVLTTRPVTNRRNIAFLGQQSAKVILPLPGPLERRGAGPVIDAH